VSGGVAIHPHPHEHSHTRSHTHKHSHEHAGTHTHTQTQTYAHSHTQTRKDTHTHLHSHMNAAKGSGEREFCIIYFEISSLSCAVCLVASRIPLSLNKLRGASAFLQPGTMISAWVPHTTAHSSSPFRFTPPSPSAVISPPLHHGQVVSGNIRNGGTLSWSFHLNAQIKCRCGLGNTYFQWGKCKEEEFGREEV
jgi:hypothetical protein